MPRHIRKEGSDEEQHHDESAEVPMRVAPRLKAIVQQKGTHEKKKRKRSA